MIVLIWDLFWWGQVSSCFYSAKNMLSYDVAKLRTRWTSVLMCGSEHERLSIRRSYCISDAAHRKGLGSIRISAASYMFIVSDDSISHVFKLMMEEIPALDFYLRCCQLDWFKDQVFQRSPWSRTKRMGSIGFFTSFFFFTLSLFEWDPVEISCSSFSTFECGTFQSNSLKGDLMKTRCAPLAMCHSSG